jgi:hypothetical protein
MIESQIFRQSGVGSRAWYISKIKIGYKAGRSGFTYLRADSGEDGKQLSFDEIKSSMSQLVAAGYVTKHGKPDAPRSDKYEVSSFGHRYLEEHKSELEQKPEPQITGAAKTGVMHTVPAAPKFDPPIPSDHKENGVTRVAKAGIALGQEIEKHKAKSISTPAPEISPLPEQRPYTPNGLKTDTPEEISPLENINIVDQIYVAIGEILLEKFKAKEGMASYTNISVYDLIEHLEKKA